MDQNKGGDSSEESGNESKESEEEVREIESTLIVKTKSVVWNFFRVKSDNDGRLSNTNKPISCKCLEPVTANYGNTSNLFNHLRCKHPLIYAQVHDKKKSKRSKKESYSKGADQQSIEHAFSLAHKYDRKGKKWQQLTNKVT